MYSAFWNLNFELSFGNNSTRYSSHIEFSLYSVSKKKNTKLANPINFKISLLDYFACIIEKIVKIIRYPIPTYKYTFIEIPSICFFIVSGVKSMTAPVAS